MKNLFTKFVLIALMCNFSHLMLAQCPTLDDVNFPPELVLTLDSISFDDILDLMTPDELVNTFGFTEEEAYATWDDPDECENMSFGFEDQAFDLGGGAFKILRNWTVLEWYTGEYVSEYQIIRNIIDLGSYCLGDITLSVDPWTCSTSFAIPSFLVGGFDYEDLISDPAEGTELQMGSHEVTINGTVEGEDFECTTIVNIVDTTPPVAVSSENISVTLDPTTCTFDLTPDIIDNGSFDGCSNVVLEVSPTTLTQADAGGEVIVTLTVTDEAGNANFVWSTIDVESCGTNNNLSCIAITTVPPLNNDGIQLYPEDFLASESTTNGDLSLTIEDEDGNIIPNDFIPQGSYGTFTYTVTDNDTGNSCWGTLSIPLPYDPCNFLACNSNVYVELSENGEVTLSPIDLAIDVANCSDLIIDISDADGNILISGAEPVITEEGTYVYSVQNTDGNSCWGTLNVGEYVPCPTSLTCNDEIFVSMYSQNGEPATATITSNMVLEGNFSSCDIENYTIELEYTGVNNGNIDDLILTMENTAATAGSSICIPMTAENFTNLQSLQGGVEWDPSVLSFTNTAEGSVTNMAYNENNADQGTLVFNWFDNTGNTPITLPTGGIVFELCFDVIGADQASTTLNVVDVDNVAVEASNSNAELVSVTSQLGVFTVGNEVVGLEFSGTGSAVVDQPGIYTYTISNPTSSCWGTLNVEDLLDQSDCPGLSDISFPTDIDIALADLTDDNLYDFISPENLQAVLGFSESQTFPTWTQVPGCNYIAYTYSDNVFILGNGSYKIVRTWTVLDWLTAEVVSDVQIIHNIVFPGLICDFLPNTEPFGDCDSGHTMDDDVEWPADLLDLADYRIRPSELELYSLVDPANSQPVFVNNEALYTVDYVDILNQLQFNQITVSRVWTVSNASTVIATYSQTLVIDISDFANLVSVNTMFERPIPDVMLNDVNNVTNQSGVAYFTGDNSVTPSRNDDPLNGLTLKDLILIQQYILGTREFSAEQLLAADVNSDNLISAIDLLELRQSILEENISSTLDWRFFENTGNLIDNTLTPKASFIGIKPGDVDDDAVLVADPQTETATMILSDVLINNGESYEATLEYEGEDLSIGVEIHIYYDESLIQIDELYVENEDMNLSYNLDKPGEIHISLVKSNLTGFLFSGENLINIKFTASSNGLLSQAIDGTSPRNSYLIGLDYNLITLNIEIGNQINTGVTDMPEHTDIFNVYPNPASDIVNFNFLEKIPSDYTIQFFDSRGMLILEKSNESKISVSPLNSGIYFYRLIDGDKAYAGQLSVIK